MTIFRIRKSLIRHSGLTSTALGLVFVPAASLAAVAYPTTCAIAQYELLSTYHELSNTPKDNKLKQNVSVTNKVLSDCIQSINGQLGSDSANSLKNANDAMNGELVYNLNALEKSGASQGQPLLNLVNHALQTASILTSQKSGINPTTTSIRKLAVQVAYLKNRYLERIYSLGGDANRDASAEPTIEQIVADFSLKLDVLRKDKSLTSRAEINKKLNAAHVRFNFLRKSILDYNNTAVPFVVTHHSSFIIKSLLEVADAAELEKPVSS